MIGQDNIHIINGRLIDPANDVDSVTDIYVSAGKIAAIGSSPEDFTTDITLDARDQIVCPGLVDIAVNLREPGYEHKATICSETAAAAKGGVTTLVCTPDTEPVIDTPAVWELIRRRAKACGKARVLAIGALTRSLEGKELAEMAALQKAGCVAVSNAQYPLANTLVTRRAMEYAATFGLPIVVHPADRHLTGEGRVHEGPVSARLGLPGIPAAAETVAVARDIALAEHTHAHAHFHSLSTAGATGMIRDARARGLPVSADVAVHQLFLLETDVDDFRSDCHVIPPLRTTIDREALRSGIADGSISAICSDHQPHDPDAKIAPFPDTAPGISGLETLLPLALKLVDEGVVDLATAIALLTVGPASILGLPYGQLSVGSDADICIFDPEVPWILDKNSMLSAGKNTPFDKWEFKGKVRYTVFEGRITYSEKAS